MTLYECDRCKKQFQDSMKLKRLSLEVSTNTGPVIITMGDFCEGCKELMKTTLYVAWNKCIDDNPTPDIGANSKSSQWKRD